MFVWDSQLSVGDGALDEHHRMFFEKVNEFELSAREGKSPEKSGQILDFMVEYAKRHFLEEEQYMLEYSFPGLGAHTRAHSEFVAQLLEFIHRFRTNGSTPDLASEIAEFMGQWLLHHIKTMDQDYARFVARVK